MTSEDLVIPFATLEFADDDLVAAAMCEHFRNHRGTSDVRLADDGGSAIFRQKKHFFKGDIVPFLDLQTRHAQLHALFGLLLKSGDVDDCKHERRDLSGRERHVQGPDPRWSLIVDKIHKLYNISNMTKGLDSSLQKPQEAIPNKPDHHSGSVQRTRREVIAFLTASLFAGCTGNQNSTAESPAEKNRKKVLERMKKLEACEHVIIDGEALIAEKPDSPPVVVLVLDEHDSPDDEWAVLEEIRAKLGINVVGMEGWAGEDADKDRGYRLLNAEEELIEKILPLKTYKSIGLEDAETQFFALRCALYEWYQLQWQNKIKNLETLHKDLEEVLARKKERAEKKGDVKSQIDYEQSKEEYEKLEREMYERDVMKGEKIFIEQMRISLGVEPSNENIARLILTIPAEMGLTEEEALDAEKMDEESNKIIIDKRSRIGVDKMLTAMEEQKAGEAVMIFGKGHKESMLEHASGRGDVNIITVRYGKK